jgi:glycosyltransferase involved in cell wall biosynthesis
VSPDIDCVVPTHGRPQYLTEALAAIGAQTHQPVRVTVVSDDGNPASRAVVEQAQSDFPTLEFRFVERADQSPGASASRNVGALVGGAPVIAFLDDDDLWCPTYLARAVECLNASGADVVVGASRRLSEAGPGKVVVPPTDLDPRTVFRSSPGVTGSTIVLRRVAFDRVGGFDPYLPVQNDRDFFLRLLSAGFRYAVQPEPLVSIRDHAFGRLTDASARRADGVLLFLSKHGPNFSWWDRRVLRYTSHYTRMSAASSPRVFVRSALGAIGNWSPTVARNLPLNMLNVARLRSMLKRLKPGVGW